MSAPDDFLTFCVRHFAPCRRHTLTDAELLSIVEHHPALHDLTHPLANASLAKRPNLTREGRLAELADQRAELMGELFRKQHAAEDRVRELELRLAALADAADEFEEGQSATCGPLLAEIAASRATLSSAKPAASPVPGMTT